MVRIPEEDFERRVEEIEKDDQRHYGLPDQHPTGLWHEHWDLAQVVLEFRYSWVLCLEPLDPSRVKSFADFLSLK
jgi:hypothetical protein